MFGGALLLAAVQSIFSNWVAEALPRLKSFGTFFSKRQMEFRIAKHRRISSDLSTILVSSAFKVPSTYPSLTHELEFLIHGRDDRKHYGLRSFRGKEAYPQSEMPLTSKLMHLVWLHCILWESINMHKGGLACIMQLPQMCALVGSVKVWVSCPAETGKVRLSRSCTAFSCVFFFFWPHECDVCRHWTKFLCKCMNADWVFFDLTNVRNFWSSWGFMEFWSKAILFYVYVINPL
jgi:hypothetical protein